MAFNAYFIVNKNDFQALGLCSKVYTKVLGDLGQKDILVTEGNLISLTYEGVILSIDSNDENPFKFDGFAALLDENDDIYLGIEIED